MTALSETLLHATAVDIDGHSVVITGRSGSGKSSLAIQLIALGARLISDDQCTHFTRGDALYVKRPETLPKAIEARGIGLISGPMADEGKVMLIVDMERTERERLPEERFVDILGHQIKMIPKSDAAHFPSAILLYLKYGFAT